MLPPSFQNTLLALEEKLRRIQTLDRTVRQAATLEEETVAYRMAEQLAEACEQAVLLARSLPACTGRPHVFWEGGPERESPTPVEMGFTKEGWFSLRMPMLLPKKESGSAAYVRMLLLPRCAGSSRKAALADQPLCVGLPPRLRQRPPRSGLAGSRQHRDQHGLGLCGPLCDGGRLSAACSHYECSAKGTEERTEIYVVPEGEFAKWLLSEKTMQEEGVALLRNRP